MIEVTSKPGSVQLDKRRPHANAESTPFSSKIITQHMDSGGGSVG
jgi:hypothetical protein